MEQVFLSGGVANKGSVVRIGDTVRRPRRSSSESVAELLGHLETVGFGGAPRFLGFDDEGREVLSWIPGEVPLPPFPEWAMSDSALASVAGLLRSYHDAVDGFAASASPGLWSPELADPNGGSGLCHNDICPENVVFQDGTAVAILDFDYVSPGTRVWDVVATSSMWAPLVAPEWRNTHPPGLDAAARVAVFCDAYGLDAADRRDFVHVVRRRQVVGRAFVQGHVQAGDAGFVEMVNQFGGQDKWDATDRWLEQEQHRLVRLLERTA